MTSYGMIQYATIAWISSPLGSRFSGIVFSGLDMCAKWTIPACRNSFYGQNVRLVGAVLLMRQGRIWSLSAWWLISPGTFTLHGGRQHDNWALHMAGVTELMVCRHRHQPTSWPINRPCTSRCLVHCWISTDLIRSLTAVIIIGLDRIVCAAAFMQ